MMRLARFALLSTMAPAVALASKLPSKLTLHVYDHCPYCNRVEFVLGKMRVKYERAVYGYGAGADPSKCEGTGYDVGGGPVPLTGKKMLPVLVGEGVPTRGDDMVGLPESLEICSFVAALGERERAPAPATGRGDIDAWLAAFKPTNTKLTRPRIPKMPVVDWADPRDAGYAAWKYTTQFDFDYAAAEAETAKLLPQASAALRELDALLRGTDIDGAPCLNEWGFSMDDVIVLPNLRMLSCVKGVEWPARVKAYLESACEHAGCKSYESTAVA